MKRCIINVDMHVLAQLLGLPDDAVIESVAPDCQQEGRLRLKVSGAGQDVKPYAMLWPTTVVVHTRRDADGTTWLRCEPQL